MKKEIAYVSAAALAASLSSLAAPAAAAELAPALGASNPTIENDAVARDAPHGPSSSAFPSHHFQWAPHSAETPALGVNFGLLQLALGGFNVAAEFRYKRLWLEYSHGLDLEMNDLGGLGLSSAEKREHVHVYVPYTTGFGVGATVLDELWVGVEFKTHRYDVNAPGGPTVGYQTYSIGPVVGYKVFLYRGLFADAYLRYWPNVATSLDGGKVALRTGNETVMHDAHSFDFFANVSIGYMFDL